MKRYRNKRTGEVVEACRVDTKKSDHVIYNNSHADLELQVCYAGDYCVRSPSGITAFYPPEKFCETFRGEEKAVEVVLLGNRVRLLPHEMSRVTKSKQMRAILRRDGIGWICELSTPPGFHETYHATEPGCAADSMNRRAAERYGHLLRTGEWSPC